MNFTLVLGIAAGVSTSLSMLPQLLKVIREKQAGDISLFAFSILIFGLSLWIFYGYMIKDVPILFTNSLALIINVLLLILSRKYKA